MGIFAPFEAAGRWIGRLEKSTQFAVRSGVLTITFKRKFVEKYFGSINVEIRHGWFPVSQIAEWQKEGILRGDEIIYIVMKAEKVPENLSTFSTPALSLSPIVRANRDQGF